MNQTAKQGLFPWFSLFTGLMGFALRCWLMSTVDAQKLFPQNHISSILSIVLLVLTLGICFYWLLKIPAQKKCKVLFPRSFVAACGNLVGAAGIAYTAWAGRSTSILFFLTPVLGLLAACALVYTGWCRFKGKQSHYLLHTAVTVYLMFYVVQHCRLWSAEPRLQIYLFPLLASLFLLMACFHRTELDMHTGNFRRYIFCNQAALFCCMLSVAGTDPLFYLACSIWMATDLCVIPDSQQNPA